MERETSATAGPPDTGDAAVDAALSALDRIEDRPLEEHPAVVDAVQAALAERLAEND